MRIKLHSVLTSLNICFLFNNRACMNQNKSDWSSLLLVHELILSFAGSLQITVPGGAFIHFTLISTFQFQNFWYKCCSFLGMTVASSYQCSPACHCQKGSMGLFLGKQFQLSRPCSSVSHSESSWNPVTHPPFPT